MSEHRSDPSDIVIERRLAGKWDDQSYAALLDENRRLKRALVELTRHVAVLTGMTSEADFPVMTDRYLR